MSDGSERWTPARPHLQFHGKLLPYRQYRLVHLCAKMYLPLLISKLAIHFYEASNGTWKLYATVRKVWHQDFCLLPETWKFYPFQKHTNFILIRVLWMQFLLHRKHTVHIKYEDNSVWRCQFCASSYNANKLTLRLLMSYIYIWSTHSWCF